MVLFTLYSPCSCLSHSHILCLLHHFATLYSVTPHAPLSRFLTSTHLTPPKHKYIKNEASIYTRESPLVFLFISLSCLTNTTFPILFIFLPLFIYIQCWVELHFINVLIFILVSPVVGYQAVSISLTLWGEHHWT